MQASPLNRIEGPPGSGKTRFIFTEAHRLIEQEGFQPESLHILALDSAHQQTLAALLHEQMTEGALPLAMQAIAIHTWDGFLKKFLKLHPDGVMFPGTQTPLSHGFEVLTRVEARILLQTSLDDYFSANPEHALAEAAKSPGLANMLYEAAENGELPTWGSALWQTFSKAREAAHFLLPQELNLLVQEAITKASESNRPAHRAIFIDEAHLLNPVQWDFLTALHQHDPSMKLYMAGTPAFAPDETIWPDSVTPIPLTSVHGKREAILYTLTQKLGLPLWEFHETSQTDLDTASALQIEGQLFETREDEAAALAQDIALKFEAGDISLEKPAFILLSGRQSGAESALLNALSEVHVPVRVHGLDEGTLRLVHFLYDALVLWQHFQTEETSPDTWQADLKNEQIPNHRQRFEDFISPEETFDWAAWESVFQEETDPLKIIWLLIEKTRALHDIENPTQAKALGFFIKRVKQLNERHQGMFGKAIHPRPLVAHFERFWRQPEEGHAAVEILTAPEETKSRHAAHVYLPFLVDSEQRFTAEMSYRQQVVQIAHAMTRSSDMLFLSAHHKTTNDPKDMTRATPSKAFHKLFPALSTAEKNIQKNPEAPKSYEVITAWNLLPVEAATAIFDTDKEPIALSASSIKTYMTCPRQFFYRHILNLEEPANPSAVTGQLVHKIFELFNIAYQDNKETGYTKARLHQIATTFFETTMHTDTKWQQALAEMTPLEIDNIQENVFKSIEDLEEKGYFSRYRHARTVLAEKRIEEMALAELPGIRLKGSIDALIEREPGIWDVIDYKYFNQNTFKATASTCQENFNTRLFEPIDETANSHVERFQRRLNANYPLGYQLPLYALALHNTPDFTGQLDALAFQLVRPALPEKPDNGAITLTYQAPDEDWEKPLAQLTHDLRTYISDPIRQETRFKTNEQRGCLTCTFLPLCDLSKDALEDLPEGEDA